ISCIEAPGSVGEARMVARQIRLLLLEGERPDDILVVLRDVLPYADLLREVGHEYAIPLDVEGTEPLLRNPAVATLLRALRLPAAVLPRLGRRPTSRELRRTPRLGAPPRRGNRHHPGRRGIAAGLGGPGAAVGGAGQLGAPGAAAARRGARAGARAVPAHALG